MRLRKGAFVSGTALLLVVFSFESLGCSAMHSNSISNRVLESITVTPTTADAQNFLLGGVLFTATGKFSKPPSPAPVPFVAPYSGGWTSSDPTIAIVDNLGFATCLGGTSGTVMITAQASSNSANPPAMSTAVSGTAQLTCP